MTQLFHLDGSNLVTHIVTADGSRLSIEAWMATQIKAGPTIAYKAADTARTAVTTLAADPDIAVAVGAGTTYQFDALLIFNETAGAVADPGFNLTLSGPASSVLDVAYSLVEAGATTTNGSFETAKGTPTTAFTSTLVGGGISVVRIIGSIRMGAIGGTLALNWGQKTSDASATTLLTGSFLTARKV